MEASYYGLSHTQRTLALRMALDLALASLKAPCTTAELVELIARPLGVSKAEQGKLSRDVVKQSPLYAGKGQCVRGQAFERYGRTMHRLNWLPADIYQKAAADMVAPAEPGARRVAKAAELAAGYGGARLQCLTCERKVDPALLVEGVCPSCRSA